MFAFIQMVLNVLTGGALDKVLGHLRDRQAQELAAMNDVQRRAHEDRLHTRETAKEIRLATAGFWEMRLLTFLIAFPFVVHLWLIGWDTMWPQPWNVEKFPEPFNEWEGAILLSFFGLTGLTTGARAIAGAIASRRR